MVIMLVVIIVIALVLLAMSGISFNDVYKILKLVNHETDIDIIKFDKCVLPYIRGNHGKRNIR